MSDIYAAASTSQNTIHIPKLECKELEFSHNRLEEFVRAVDDVVMDNKVVNLTATMRDFFQLMEVMNADLKMATRPKAVEEMLNYHTCSLHALITARNTNPADSQQIEAQQIDGLSEAYDSAEKELSKVSHGLNAVEAKYAEAKDEEESKGPPRVIQVQPQGSHLLETWRIFYRILPEKFNNGMPNALSNFKDTLETVAASNLFKAQAAASSSSCCQCVVQ